MIVDGTPSNCQFSPNSLENYETSDEQRHGKELLSQMYFELFNKAPFGILHIDAKGNIKLANSKTLRLLNSSCGRILHSQYLDWVHQQDIENARCWLESLNSKEPVPALEMRLLSSQGEKWVKAHAIFSHAGMQIIWEDINDRKKLEILQLLNEELISTHDRLRFLSIRDPLTGLYNRQYFEEEINRLQKSRYFPMSVLIIDVDGLKIINDSFGHQKGDELLRITARVLKKPFRESDMVARIGGDEFAVILPCTSKATALTRRQEILNEVQLYNENNNGLSLSLSMGVATAETKGITMEEIIKQADSDMYRFKLTKSTLARTVPSTTADETFFSGHHEMENCAERIAELAELLGQELGMDQTDLGDLKILAFMRDIGNVGIADHILLKKDLITGKDKKELQKHTEIGYKIAMASRELKTIARYILHHHERWDGTGYPAGLKGKEIPLHCRILSLVEAFMELTADQSCQESSDLHNAVIELKKYAENRLDPELVGIFIDKVVKNQAN